MDCTLREHWTRGVIQFLSQMKVLRQSNLGRKLRFGLIITIHLSMVMIIIMLMASLMLNLNADSYPTSLVMNLIKDTTATLRSNGCTLLKSIYTV